MIEVLSLGAGVQSTTILMMIEIGELPPVSCAVFADTGWEPPAVYDHLVWLEKNTTTPIHRVSVGNIRDDHINGHPRNGLKTTIPFYVDTGGKREGRTYRACTRDYKLNPMNAFIRSEILGLKKWKNAKPNSVRKWLGISIDEVQRVKPSREKWQINYYPLVERRISRNYCYQWLQQHGFPEPPRSACVGCPFHSDKEWRRLRNDEPEAFADAVLFDSAMRNHRAINGKAYLHRSLVPLDKIDFDNDVDRGQRLLWQDECEGLCGV